MIGFQCAPAAGKAPESRPEEQTSAASSPASRRSSASPSSSASSCSAASSPRDLAGRLVGHLRQQLPSIQQHGAQSASPSHHQSKMAASGSSHTGALAPEEGELAAGSPGYHSAAPSPGGSTNSSVASPVSSCASTGATSVCSSSGISTAASLLSVAATAGLLQHQQAPITTTASMSTQRAGQPPPPPHQQPQSQPACGGAVGASLAANQMGQQLAMQQQHTNRYAPMMRHQHQQQQQQRHNQSQANNGLGALLEHFAEARHEPLNLSWFHEANNRAALSAALSGPKLMVAGDISLAEMSRYPVPIMARPPLGVSDLTLENWLTDVLQARKGIKLTFTSTRTVEPAFRVLARHADQLRGPLVLSADILARPQPSAGNQSTNKQQQQHQQQQPVDAWTFLMLCRTRFPKSIISIGWCGAACGSSLAAAVCESAPADPTLGQPESMFELDLLEQHQFGAPMLQLGRPQQPLVFQPHAALLARQPLQAGRPAQFGNPACASGGSLNSSSGNSSGSPSPTSPVASSSLFGTGQTGPRMRQQQQHQRQLHPLANSAASSAEQLIMAAAAAAAAQEHKSPVGANLKGGWSAVAAAMVARLQQQQQDQLPLNLNINEAEPQVAGAASLQELAQTIQQLQQQSSSLESLSNSLHQQQQQQQQQPQSGEAAAAALALATNILQANAGNPHTGHAHQLLINQLREAQKWEHVSKKVAVGHRLNSNSPSPISTSPKQQPASAINLLSCVSSSPSASFQQLNRAHQLHQQQQQQHQHIRMGQQALQPEVAGYTREMIDKMSSLVKEYNLTQAITFPVQARWLVRRHSAHFAHSLSELQRLLFQVGPNSTLTLVAQPEDLISADELQLIRKHFAPNQILFDLPGELAQAVKQHELATSGGDR